MKIFLSYILIFVIGFRPLAPFIEYGLNYSYYKNVLCVNKDKPKMKCNGKCQLMKKLVTESDQSENSNKITLKVLDNFINKDLQYSILDIFESRNKVKVNSNYLNRYCLIRYIKLDKPPIFS